ncbi:MAG: hypothetical protein ABJC74_13330 [Gemmatimonadota bacterium]
MKSSKGRTTDPGPEDLGSALNSVLQDDQARARAAAVERRPRSPNVRGTALVALGLVAAWLLIAPPAWLQPVEPDLPPPALTVRTSASTMVTQAIAMVAFYRERGRLPGTLGELGPEPSDIRYQANGGASFELRMAFGDSIMALPVVVPPTGQPDYTIDVRPGVAP